jgi:hypothetical protein
MARPKSPGARRASGKSTPALTRARLVRGGGGALASLLPLAGVGLAACGGEAGGQAPAAPSSQPVTLVLNTDWVA